MLKIRLQRIDRKNETHFRLVLTDSKNATKSGKFLEILGSYNPKLSTFVCEKAEVSKWIANGAQVTPTVHNFLVKEGVVEGKKKNVLPKKSPTTKRKEK